MKKVLFTLMILLCLGSLVLADCPTGVAIQRNVCAPQYQAQAYQQQAQVAYAYPVAFIAMPTVAVQVQQAPVLQQPQQLQAPQPLQVPQPQVMEQPQVQSFVPNPVVVRQVQQSYYVPQQNFAFAQSYGYANQGVSVQHNIVRQNVVRAPVVIRRRASVIQRPVLVQRQRVGLLGRLFSGHQAGQSRTTVIIRR